MWDNFLSQSDVRIYIAAYNPTNHPPSAGGQLFHCMLGGCDSNKPSNYNLQWVYFYNFSLIFSNGHGRYVCTVDRTETVVLIGSPLVPHSSVFWQMPSSFHGNQKDIIDESCEWEYNH